MWGTPTITTSGPGSAVCATLSTDVGESVSIATNSGTGYTKPTQFTISASLNMGGLTGPGPDTVGVGLGFFSTQGSPSGGWTNFTGLWLNPVDGRLCLVKPQHNVVESVVYGAGWDSTAWHTLSYSVNTADGSISNVVLDGTSRSYVTTGLFTDAATKYAGFAVGSTTGSTSGYVDNFVVSTVPEPSTLSLLAAGLVGLLAYAWRKRR